MKESINNYTEDNESIKNSEKSILSPQPEETSNGENKFVVNSLSVGDAPHMQQDAQPEEWA